MVCTCFKKTVLCLSINSKTENEFALGLRDCKHKMGQKPSILYTEGRTGITNDCVLENVDERHTTWIVNKITYIFY